MDEDEAFHALVAEATRNSAVTRSLASVAHRLQVTPDAVLQRNGRPRRSLEQNQGVLAAIEPRDPALATRRMGARIRSIARVLFAPGVLPPDARQPPGGSGDTP